ncbi:MAG: hypothetical protein NWQ06_00080, partial [Leeuwenhoekiella sp.]|nr:hypothetical protein [Leeuwenhoekiella sp.]
MSFKLILASFSIVLLLGCSSDTKHSKSGTYIGGEIVNPTSNYIILKKDDLLIDTIALDQNNRFSYKLKSVKKGLYNIFHNEQQLIYLEPGDSLL